MKMPPVTMVPIPVMPPKAMLSPARRRSLGERRLARQDEAGRLGTGSDGAGNSPKHTGPHLTGCGSDCESGPEKNPASLSQRGESSLVGAAGVKGATPPPTASCA